MSIHDAIPLALADRIGADLLKALSGIAADALIVGSVRRRVAEVHDVEAVILPLKTVPQADLFGEMHAAGPPAVVDRLRRTPGWHILSGKPESKIIRLEHVATKATCEVYIVDDPRSWGTQIVVRTGPQAFGIGLMQRARRQGKHYADSFLLHAHPAPCDRGPDCPFILNITDEPAVFAALGMSWKPPEDRR